MLRITLLVAVLASPAFAQSTRYFCVDKDDCQEKNTVVFIQCSQEASVISNIKNGLMQLEDSVLQLVLVKEDNDSVWISSDFIPMFSNYCNDSYVERSKITAETVLSLVKKSLLKYKGKKLDILVFVAKDITPLFDNERALPMITEVIDLSDPEKNAFHFFVDPNAPSSTIFGSVEHTVAYNDSSHFNKALTLSKLIYHNFGWSIQAHLLSVGILATVNDYGSFPSIPYVPMFDYIDLCVSITCPKDWFCSPLHGCIPLSQSRPEGVLGKVPLEDGAFTKTHDKYVPYSHSFNDGDNHTLSITEPSGDPTKSMSLSDIVVGGVKTLDWEEDEPFVKKVIEDQLPVVLKNTVVSKWGALRHWDLSYVSEHIGMETLVNVKCSDDLLTFDPDYRTPLKLKLSLPFSNKNMSKDAFFSCVQKKKCDYQFTGYYYFGSIPEGLKEDLLPDSYLYHTEKDHRAQRQFIWISSEGMITHGHFDQDYNIFVQLIGKKRFTLWLPWQHELMYVFPRVHPLWHKSRLNFADLDVSKFPGFSHSQAIQVTLGPGDVLYVPPYTWHYVETLSTSVSLSTWSHDYHMYDNMNAVYRHDHKFDLIQNPKGTVSPQ